MQITKYLLLCCLVVAIFASCRKETSPSVEITVINGATNAISAGATIKLYSSTDAVTSNNAQYIKTTDVGGKVKFNVTHQSQYYIIVENGTAKNFYSGLIPTAIFKTQADINNSPHQTPAGVIGGIKFQDTNGDGAITVQDNVVAPSIMLTSQTTNSFNVTIY
jgi:hypothetical protein